MPAENPQKPTIKTWLSPHWKISQKAHSTTWIRWPMESLCTPEKCPLLSVFLISTRQYLKSPHNPLVSQQTTVTTNSCILLVWNWSRNRFYSIWHFWPRSVRHPEALPLCFKKGFKILSEKHHLICFSGEADSYSRKQCYNNYKNVHHNGKKEKKSVLVSRELKIDLEFSHHLALLHKISAVVICVMLDTCRLQWHCLKPNTELASSMPLLVLAPKCQCVQVSTAKCLLLWVVWPLPLQSVRLVTSAHYLKPCLTGNTKTSIAKNSP